MCICNSPKAESILSSAEQRGARIEAAQATIRGQPAPFDTASATLQLTQDAELLHKLIKFSFLIIDPFTLAVSPDTNDGPHQLLLALYNFETGERLLLPNGADHLTIPVTLVNGNQ